MQSKKNKKDNVKIYRELKKIGIDIKRINKCKVQEKQLHCKNKHCKECICIGGCICNDGW